MHNLLCETELCLARLCKECNIVSDSFFENALWIQPPHSVLGYNVSTCYVIKTFWQHRAQYNMARLGCVLSYRCSVYIYVVIYKSQIWNSHSSLSVCRASPRTSCESVRCEGSVLGWHDGLWCQFCKCVQCFSVSKWDLVTHVEKTGCLDWVTDGIGLTCHAEPCLWYTAVNLEFSCGY